MLAQSFMVRYQRDGDVCIYAAGVSNSSCSDEREFDRERTRLLAAIEKWRGAGPFAYFGTCSVGDVEVRHTAYVQHKLAMERLVREHPDHVIMRLPQVAGVTPNPHTLMNFLHSRISRSEKFSVWRNAYRNIIDVDDVAALGTKLLDNPRMRGITLNLANPVSYSMLEIVSAMESVVGKPAIYDVLERGHHYSIDVTAMSEIVATCDIDLGNNYLDRTIRKYYEHH